MSSETLIDGLMADTLAGVPGVRDRMLQQQAAAHAAGDALLAGRLAQALVLHTLADFADFRGLTVAWADLENNASALNDAAGVWAWRTDAVRLGRPGLDHRFVADDPALGPPRERLYAGLRAAVTLPADERLLLAKVVVDHDGLRGDMPAAIHVLALMQEVVPLASPRWQAIWWQLVAQNHEWQGENDLAQAALQHMQVVLATLDAPELRMSLACEDMRQALHTSDLVRAERACRVIDQCRPLVRPALLPRGLRMQCALFLRRGQYQGALDHTALILSLCEDHEVPERDRAGYVEERAHALAGLGRHAEAVALLEGLRSSQVAGQAQVLEAIIAMAQAAQALAAGTHDLQRLVLSALDLAVAAGFSRFLMPFPAWAAEVAGIGLQAGVHTEFLHRAIRERRLPPPLRHRSAWPWPVQVWVLGRLQIHRFGVPLARPSGKVQKKPMELLALLAAHPAGLDAETLIDALWPSLDAEAPKSSLEMAISRLRKTLEMPDAVRVADGRVSLKPELVWTDAGAFEAAVAAQDAASALGLYRAPLLQGEHLSGLLLQARERLAAKLCAGVLQAVEALRQQGQPGQALVLLGKGLAAEPQSLILQAALRL